MGEQAVLPARQKHGIELQALGAVQGQDVDRVIGLGQFRVHHQADMFQKAAQFVEWLQGDDQLLQILQLGGRLDVLAGLPHGGIAAFVQHHLGQFTGRHGLNQAAPAVEIVQQPRQAVAGPSFQVVAVDHDTGHPGHTLAHIADGLVQQLHGGVAQGPFRRVDDAFER